MFLKEYVYLHIYIYNFLFLKKYSFRIILILNVCLLCGGSTIVHFSNIFNFYVLSFFHLIIWNFQISFHLKITTWSTIVWFVWAVHYCVQLASWCYFFHFFLKHSFYSLPLLKFFLLLSYWISFFHLKFSEMLISQNIWCLIRTQLRNITQTIFQGGSAWAPLIHNSLVYLRGPLLCPDASWGDFFQTIPLPFPLLKFFFYFLNCLN